MKLLDLAKRMCNSSNCEVIISQNLVQIKQPQKVADLKRKIEAETIENFTINTFAVIDNKLIVYVK